MRKNAKRKTLFVRILTGIFLTFAGILVAGHIKILSAVLIVSGILILLFSFFADIFANKRGLVCPACGHHITWMLPVTLRKQDGLFPCPKCGSLMRVSKLNRFAS